MVEEGSSEETLAGSHEIELVLHRSEDGPEERGCRSPVGTIEDEHSRWGMRSVG